MIKTVVEITKTLYKQIVAELDNTFLQLQRHNGGWEWKEQEKILGVRKVFKKLEI